VRVEIEVLGPTADPGDTEAIVFARAAEIALHGLREIWPVRTGRSRDGLRATADAVVGAASYTDDVTARGSDVPIVDSNARVIGEIAATKAVVETASEVSETLDGVLISILSEHLER